MIPLYQHLNKGRTLLLIIPLFIMGAGIALTILYTNFIGELEGISFAIVLGLGIVLSISIGWLWWSYWVVLWKIEGLEKVKDVHLLYRRAVSSRLIWPQDHKYEKTELRFGERRKRLDILEEKLDLPRVEEWIVDESIPEEYQIPASKTGLYIGIILLLVAVVFFFIIKNTIAAICFMVFALFGFWTFINHRKKGAIFMTLNSESIEVNRIQIPWTEIREFEVIHQGYGNEQKTYLILQTSPDSFGHQEIDIARANASRSRLEYLLDVFHSRYRKKQSES
ncbi:MAG: hypothetical protein R8P61_35915 [Bacteroidia bacterium]|nr:hypothetical protein [Bacteroidia bacterium]